MNFLSRNIYSVAVTSQGLPPYSNNKRIHLFYIPMGPFSCDVTLQGKFQF